VRRLLERLQILIVGIAALAWLCGSPGFVSEAQAGDGGIGGGCGAEARSRALIRICPRTVNLSPQHLSTGGQAFKLGV